MGSYIYAFLVLVFVAGCKNEVQDVASTSNTESTNELSEIEFLNLSGASAILKSSDSSGIGVLSNDSSLKRLYAILEDGKYRKLTYLDSNGIERNLELTIQRIDWVSKRYVAVSFSNGFEALIDLQKGSVFKLKKYDLDLRSLVVFSKYLFGFSKDLMQLKRIDLSTRESVVYVTLPENSQFMTGPIAPVSYSNIWWDDAGYTSDNSKNFRSMLADEDLNVFAQVSQLDPVGFPVYPSYSISPAGQMAKNNFIFHNGSLLNFVYSGDKLYALIPAFSGPNRSIAFNRVHITQNGFVFDLVQKILPFDSVPGTYGLGQLYCRDNYTIDSSQRYTIMYWGVINFSDKDLLNPIQYSYSSVNLRLLEEVNSYPYPYLPSRSCFISGDYVYFMSQDHTQILRADLRTISTFSYSVVVSRADLMSFVIAGKNIIYSTQSLGLYKSNLNGTNEVSIDGDALPDPNDIANVN